MKTNELRIGNYVDYEGHTVKILAIDSEREYLDLKCSVRVENAATWLNHLHGIPLTEQLLLMIGFERVDNSLFSIPINNGWRIMWEVDYIYLKYLDTECEVSHVKFEYVHQLQNLYFALAGEELEIKP